MRLENYQPSSTQIALLTQTANREVGEDLPGSTSSLIFPVPLLVRPTTGAVASPTPKHPLRFDIRHTIVDHVGPIRRQKPRQQFDALFE